MGNFCQTDTRGFKYVIQFFQAPEPDMAVSKIEDLGASALQKNSDFESQAFEARIIQETEFLTQAEIQNNDYIISLKNIDQSVIAASKSGKFSIYNWELQLISSFSQPQMCGGIEVLKQSGKFLLISIATDFDSTAVNLWDINQKQQIDSLGKFEERIWNIKIFENCNNILLCLADGSVEVWSLDNLTRLQQIKLHSQPVTDALTYQNDFMITGSKDNSLIFVKIFFNQTIFQYNLQEQSQINKIEVSDWIYCLCLININFFCAGIGQGEVQVFRIKDFSLQNTFKIHNDYIGSYVMTSSKDGKNQILSLTDGKLYNDCEKTTSYEIDAEPLCKIKSKGLIIFGNANNIVSYGYFSL